VSPSSRLAEREGGVVVGGVGGVDVVVVERASCMRDVKRDLHSCQKRPTLVSKETYISVRERAACVTSVCLMTYIRVKRDLH
jgi:hypothetical protein